MASQKKRLIIIDGNALVHRSYHALPVSLTTRKGELVNAVYGFLLFLFKALKEFHPEYAAASFDLAAPTFRHEEFKQYKAKRVKAPDELYEQIPKIKEFLKIFHIPIFEKERYEADDVIGTISTLVSKKNDDFNTETIILTGDLDTLQLVDENTKVYTFRRGIRDTILYDKEKVKGKYGGLKPSQLPDFKALRGDPSDNIPGVLGIGEKTAIPLIKDFGSLENLFKELEENSEKAKKIKSSLKEKLLKSKETAFFSKTLVSIKKDTPLDFDLERCRWDGYDKEKAIGLLKSFEFYSLINRLPSLSEKSDSLEQKTDFKNGKLF